MSHLDAQFSSELSVSDNWAISMKVILTHDLAYVGPLSPFVQDVPSND